MISVCSLWGCRESKCACHIPMKKVWLQLHRMAMVRKKATTWPHQVARASPTPSANRQSGGLMIITLPPCLMLEANMAALNVVSNYTSSTETFCLLERQMHRFRKRQTWRELPLDSLTPQIPGIIWAGLRRSQDLGTQSRSHTWVTWTHHSYYPRSVLAGIRCQELIERKPSYSYIKVRCLSCKSLFMEKRMGSHNDTISACLLHWWHHTSSGTQVSDPRWHKQLMAQEPAWTRLVSQQEVVS